MAGVLITPRAWHSTWLTPSCFACNLAQAAKSALLSERSPHSSAGAGSRSTRRTWMMCDDAERQMGSRPLCTMATCWPPTTNFRCLSSWIALPLGTCKASARVPRNQCIDVQHKRLPKAGGQIGCGPRVLHNSRTQPPEWQPHTNVPLMDERRC